MARKLTGATAVKAAVRERDRFRCTYCGMANDQHRQETGRQLHVHRLAPGSLYTLAGCVTTCEACHPLTVRRKPGQTDLNRPGLRKLVIEIPQDLKRRLDALAGRRARQIKAEVILALRTHIDAEALEPDS